MRKGGFTNRLDFKSTFKPVGVLGGTFEELHAAGCIQTGADVYALVTEARQKFQSMFSALQMATSGNICDGCPALHGGDCTAYKQYHEMPQKQKQYAEQSLKAATTAPGTQKYPGMSVKQIAKELGISIGEVRRRKQAGII